MRNRLALLRDAAWLTAERARAYARVLAVMAALGVLAAGTTQIGDVVRIGQPEATDFVAFWSGARLAAAGRPQSAYDGVAMNAAERQGGKIAAGQFFPYFYPPVFLLLCLPLAALAYLPAFAAFMACGYALLVGALRQILPQSWAWTPILASPALLMNYLDGQNGFVTAGCFAAAMLTLDASPALGGAALGLLVIKPHLALGVPIALAASRRWTSFLTCGLTALGLCGLSWVILGSAPWHAFLLSMAQIRDGLENHPEDWSKLLSVFTAVRQLGFGLSAAYAAQAIIAAATLTVLARNAARRPAARGLIAMLAAASILLSPHVMDYDMVCLILPLAWIFAEAQHDGWRPWEKTVLLAIYVLPLIARLALLRLGLPLAPPLLIALLLLTVRRLSPRPTCIGEPA